ncbi:HAD-IIIA family hydrolase [Magnetospira thiophila]
MNAFDLPDGAFIDDELIWNQCLTPAPRPGPALFLDRDGVVVVEVNYLHEPDKTILIPGAAEVIVRANHLGRAVVLVTNQAGIARGMYGWPEFAATQARLIDLLAAQGAHLDAVYACPHHKSGQPPYGHPSHPARKPNPGLLLRAAAQMSLDMKSSWIIGDRASDIAAGRNAGLAGGLHVLTGHGSREGELDAVRAEARDGYEVRCADSIAEGLNLPILS